MNYCIQENRIWNEEVCGGYCWYTVDCWNEDGEYLGHCTFNSQTGEAANCSGVFINDQV